MIMNLLTCALTGLWEIYQLLQKVTLVGLLGFITPGSLTQVALGVVVTELMLIAFVRTMPYADMRTNILMGLAQTIMVFSYCSTMLLKVCSRRQLLHPIDLSG